MIYDPNFKEGDRMRIADHAALAVFLRTWRYHHKLQPEQLAFAGTVAEIESTGIYHGGAVIYKVRDLPGMWHEKHLSAG